MKKIYVDIGELGWSLHLSAHVRWLKQHTDDYVGVMTYVDRRCLYSNIADATYDIPSDFCEKFKRSKASFFGITGRSTEELNNYFKRNVPPGYMFLACFSRHKKFKTNVIFKPYSFSKELNGKKEILILPRCRNISHHKKRNLSEEFYIKVIDTLCARFPNYIIRTMGIPLGAYSINGIKRTNYINDVREGADLQDLIDRCQVAVAAVGSQSAPPKIALLQGVPTFMIGHQRERHINADNWMSTKAEFYDISREKYYSMNSENCISKIISFIEGCQ